MTECRVLNCAEPVVAVAEGQASRSLPALQGIEVSGETARSGRCVEACEARVWAGEEGGDPAPELKPAARLSRAPLLSVTADA